MNYAIIIPCGHMKRTIKCAARDLYIGSLFKANLRWALSVAATRDIYILSAKYGLVTLSTHLEPYDQYMGKNGSVPIEVIREQAEQFGLMGKKIYALGGKNYKDVLKKVFTHIQFPLPAVSMGYQMQLLKKNLGRLPKWE